MSHAFYSPHGYIQDQLAARRVRRPGHAEFDVLLARTGDGRLHAYVNSAMGQESLADVPDLRIIRVPPQGLQIMASGEGRTLHVLLESSEGPLRGADIRMVAPANATPRIIDHATEPLAGRPGQHRIDLALDGLADGHLEGATKKDRRELANVACIITLGSHVVPA